MAEADVEKKKLRFVYLGYEYHGSQKKYRYFEIKSEEEVEKHIEQNLVYDYKWDVSVYAKPMPSNVKIGFIIEVEGTEFGSTIYPATAKLIGKKINEIGILDLKVIQQGVDSERLAQTKVKDSGSIFQGLENFKLAYKRANPRNQQLLLLKLFDYLNT